MGKQEADKIKAEQESQIEDLPVDGAQQDEVKGVSGPRTVAYSLSGSQM